MSSRWYTSWAHTLIKWTKVQTGMQAIEMLSNGTLDIGILGSTPVTIALSVSSTTCPYCPLPIEVISMVQEQWESAGLIVQSEIQTPEVGRMQASGLPPVSKSHCRCAATIPLYAGLERQNHRHS